MTQHRKLAFVAGILFIVATASSLTSYIGILDPILAAPDYLARIAANVNLVRAGVLFELVNNAAIIAISLVLFPVLRTFSTALAVAYVATRVVEAILITIGDISILTLSSIAPAYAAADVQSAAAYEAAGRVLLAVVDWTFLLGPGMALAFTALVLNYVLLRARLVPAILSLWGLAGALLLFIGDLVAVFGPDMVLIFAAPFALQEMVFALWLIFRGFSLAGDSALRV